ncbi:MAG: four helix bundle protein [Bacteroidetes bacterium]|jgi:four helix bundle protein|nr:four helix bundle protein [Bacteroidota bacterium]
MEYKKREVGSFEDLEVWRQARKIHRIISEMTKKFPKIEQYRLEDQLIRSSRSIARNIAEGYGRYHYQENIHFCRISRGSLSEVLNDSITALDENYITQDELDKLRREIEINNRLLNGYINYLRKAKTGDQVKEERVNYGPR